MLKWSFAKTSAVFSSFPSDSSRFLFSHHVFCTRFPTIFSWLLDPCIGNSCLPCDWRLPVIIIDVFLFFPLPWSLIRIKIAGGISCQGEPFIQQVQPLTRLWLATAITDVHDQCSLFVFTSSSYLLSSGCSVGSGVESATWRELHDCQQVTLTQKKEEEQEGGVYMGQREWVREREGLMCHVTPCLYSICSGHSTYCWT